MNLRPRRHLHLNQRKDSTPNSDARTASTKTQHAPDTLPVDSLMILFGSGIPLSRAASRSKQNPLMGASSSGQKQGR